MIDADVRNAIYQLHLAGASLRAISRQFAVSRNTVRWIIRRQGAAPQPVRKDKIQVNEDLLRRLHQECGGWIRRIYERLTEEEQVSISYPTLTRLLRELGLGPKSPPRSDRVPDEPGAEMQHDTTVYTVRLSGQPTRVIASLLYLRYSKRRYLRFYAVFNRFAMKCFLHEALMHWGYSANQCIIDNTNLARLRGSGKRAVIVPEMVSFSARYAFQFACHAINHSNRKAGVERGFWGVETNFLPGRVFDSLEDLNAQALEWATVRLEHRPVGTAKLIPAKAFEHERHDLTPLSPHLPAPYCAHKRGTDQYGYVAFLGNYYWVPGEKRVPVKVLQYADRIAIYEQRSCVAEYPLPRWGVKNERFNPPGQPAPRHQPHDRKRSSQLEEKRLRAMGSEVAAYVDYVLATPGIQRHRFLRELLAFSQQVTPTIFARALERARRYRVVHLPTIRRIAWLCLSQNEQDLPLADVDGGYRERPSYQEGSLTDEPDLSIYDTTYEDDWTRTSRKARNKMDEALRKMLHQMGLFGLLEHWDQWLAQAQRGRFSHERLLRFVIESESALQNEHARLLRRKRARLPEAWEMETFPFSRQPKLNRKRIMSLYDGFDYITRKRNMIWLGPTGCGKTGLASAFLLHAVDRGYRGQFVTFADLVAQLYASVADHSQEKVIRRYGSYDCLLIDEVGYVEVEPAQVGLFFTLMQRRHKTKTTLITSNLGFSDWGTFLRNPSLTSALLDRLTETSHVINMKHCRSLRDKLDDGDGSVDDGGKPDSE